ncbi:26956_t:CDS:1, partial [Dentiscutata erythropus]
FLNKLQKDTARLFEVVYSFASTIKIFKEHQDLDFGSKMVKRIEKHWKEWEHPLLILSIILHPDYKLEKFQSTNNNLT